MLHSRLSIDAMSTFSWRFDREFTLWSDMGVAYAGLLWAKLADGPEERISALDAAGICTSTIIVEPFDLATPESWERTRRVHRQALDLVAAHGGLSIYFTPGRTTGARWQEDLERFAEAVAPTVSHARAMGVAAAIEPSLRTSVSFVNTLRDAIDVAERTGIGIVADFGNMWMERDFREVLQRAAPHLALIQICDIIIGTRANPPPGGRVHIGEGDLPIERMIQDVLDAGYEGPFDLEVVAADYTAACDEAALKQGIIAASELLYRMHA
jgi:sugar phosphate isomerase/epimerase